MNKRLSHSINGFTLIELLSVVIVVAILCALIVPAVLKQQRTANTVACLYNLKQIGTLIHMYASDNDGCITPLRVGAPDGTHFTWEELLNPYENEEVAKAGLSDNSAIYYCPAFEQKKLKRVQNGYATSFTANRATMQDVAAGKSAVRLNSVKYPSRTILLADGLSYDAGGVASILKYSQTKPDDDGCRVNYGLHEDTANFLFVDGHAERLISQPQGPDIHHDGEDLL